jgi:hypothetical protein
MMPIFSSAIKRQLALKSSSHLTILAGDMDRDGTGADGMVAEAE